MTASGALLTPVSTTNPIPAQGSWNTWVFEYFIPTGDAIIGTTLGFIIDIATNGIHQNIAFDNLRIDYQTATSAVPEPSSLALLGLGLLGFGVASLRKKG